MSFVVILLLIVSVFVIIGLVVTSARGISKLANNIHLTPEQSSQPSPIQASEQALVQKNSPNASSNRQTR
jgi:predicted PurR-regulated permease PerM